MESAINPILREAASHYLMRYGADTFPSLFRAAHGAIVIDDEGREILDFTSGQICATLGHNHPKIVAAVQEALAESLDEMSRLSFAECAAHRC